MWTLIMSLMGSSRGIPDHGICNPCHFDLFEHLIAVLLKGFHSAQYLIVTITDPHLCLGLYSIRED